MAKRFCLMTHGRSGSTALMRILAAHDDIAVPSSNVESPDEELSHPYHRQRYIDAYAELAGYRARNLDELFEQFYECNQSAAFAGFKSMPQRHDDLAGFVERANIHFITLVREDLASTVASFLLANRIRDWRSDNRTANATWRFESADAAEVASRVTFVTRARAALQSISGAIALTYEQLCQPDFENLELDKVFGRSIRLDDPRPPTNAADYVENWDAFLDFVERAAVDPAAAVAEGAKIASPAVPPATDAQRATNEPTEDRFPMRDFRSVESVSVPDRMKREIPIIGASEKEVQQLLQTALSADEGEEAFQDLQTFCTFIGYPRSGHTVIGSLLDAHPNCCIAIELDTLRFLQPGVTAEQLYRLVIKNSQVFNTHGRQWGDYTYVVPNQYHGRVENLRVLGDNKGGRTTVRVAEDPELLTQLIETIPIEHKFVHVVRNPFDNITTIAMKQTRSVERAFNMYFKMCRGNKEIKSKVGADRVFELYQEEFIADPIQTLSRLCEFLGLSAPDDYLEACAATIYQQPNKSRHKIQWTSKAVAAIDRAKQEFDFLQEYRFND